MPASRKELNNGKYIDDQMGNGVPEGGTTGQVLTKASNDDYDTEWVTGGGGGSGTVTSVQLAAGTGISLTGTNPITTSGTITITNDKPFTSPLTTKGDIYVRDNSTDTRLPVGLDTQVLLADSTTSTGLKWGSNTTPTPTGYYGAWQDNVTQTAAASNTGYAMIFRTIDLSNGVSIVTNGTNLTRITFANTGIYNLQFSSQFQNLANSPQDVTIWLRKNGTDISGSAGIVGLEARKNPGDPYHIVTGWNYVLSVVGGEYYELVWSTTDHINVSMNYYPAGSPPPAAASVILTITQQSGIMAGTGITAINSLTGAVQTLGVGTSGTDFGISSSGTSHTFNLPTASSTNRGALSSSDWTNFNTAYNNRITSLTTTGSSGSATLSSNVLNIPTYTLSGLGGQPQLSGTGFVKASGTTITYDNSTYLTSAITSLGGLTGATQTLGTGTSGTDFGIVSSGTSHTFNLPTASASNTGKLSSTDWSTFNNKGYALNIGSTQISFLASTTYYFGMPTISASTTAAIRRVYIPQSGTIKGGQIYMRTTAATSTENWTLSIRLNNSAGATTTFSTLGNNSQDKIFSASGLNISVVAGDYIEIITTTPAWTTAPGNTNVYGSIFIQ